MPRNLYIAASEPRSGKSLVVLGVMEMLSRRVQRLGFFRPIIRDRGGPDNDTELIRSRYQLAGGERPLFGATYQEAQQITNSRGSQELLKQILARYKAIESECEFILCEGTDFSGVTSALEFDFNAQIANHLGCPVLMVISGHDRAPGEIAEASAVTRRAFLEEGCQVAATVINRVAPEQLEQVREAARDAWPDDDPVYCVAEAPSLDDPTMGMIAQALGAELLYGEELDQNREVRHVAVAAMQLPNFLDRLHEATLVITPGDRADVLLGSLATLVSENYPQINGILLTGGLRPEPSVIRLIEGFRRSLTPIFSVATDTYETVRDVMSVEGAISPNNERKIAAALGVFESAVDAAELERRIDVTRSTSITPLMFEYELIEQAKRDKQRIVLPEGEEPRILRAAEILRSRDVVDITLLGNAAAIADEITSLGWQLDEVDIVDPEDSPWLDEFAEKLYEYRKHRGMNLDTARDLVHDVSYFGTMMVQEGKAGGMVSGSIHTTAHTIRPAFQIIRTKPDCMVVSSVMFMCLSDRVLVYGDCAVNPNPNAEELADIAIQSAGTAQMFGVEPRIAMLSYSTGESGHGDDVQLVKEATRIARERRPDLLIEGPIQYDAAIDAGVARTKLPDSEVAGRATVFIFPDLNTGNNTYKAVQRSSGAVAVGPVLQGLKKPVNDLSRGCTVTDIVNTVAITAIQAQAIQNSQ